MANANNFDETNIYLDLDPINPEPNHLGFKKPGKKKDAVWNYFIEDEVRKAGHSSSKCVYCDEVKDRGRVPDMMAHLALQRESIKASVKEEYLKILAESSNQTSGKPITKKQK